MQDFRRELEEYTAKLRKQTSGIDRILSLNHYGLIPREDMETLRSIRGRAAALLDKLEKGEYEIAIVGLEKAGKSTFANALMENDVLPSKDPRCTYTTTSIRYGTTDYATVEFFSREEFDRSFRANLKKMGIPHAEDLSFFSLSLRDYQQAFEKLSEDHRACGAVGARETARSRGRRRRPRFHQCQYG